MDGRQRDRVLRLVREHDEAVDAQELAGQLGLHVSTVRFHLDTLCEQGLVERTRIAPAGVGRPRTGYVAARGRLDYQSLAEILALELGDTTDKRQRRAEHAGRRWAQRITADSPAAEPADEPLDRRAALTVQVFDQMGFAPQPAPLDDPATRTIRLHACPVRGFAAAHPEVGCALHRGLLEGLVAGHAELEPFVEPELCIARVIAHD
ncbi:helix-turn-helix transcriptional regulator [Mycobacterium kyorinense]|uniref:Transcriptional regulator n=1 Tax=Mycobacterium kyorinense TaxID=487514 RepID=A0A1X1XJZ0_9MYCO|nr:helix-turn-helix domain-containing protein [Mycobacterium kyorinense]ORV99048.1 transcriptional regulator [Mycobacterium kyorinense]